MDLLFVIMEVLNNYDYGYFIMFKKKIQKIKQNKIGQMTY